MRWKLRSRQKFDPKGLERLFWAALLPKPELHGESATNSEIDPQRNFLPNESESLQSARCGLVDFTLSLYSDPRSWVMAGGKRLLMARSSHMVCACRGLRLPSILPQLLLDPKPGMTGLWLNPCRSEPLL